MPYVLYRKTHAFADLILVYRVVPGRHVEGMKMRCDRHISSKSHGVDVFPLHLKFSPHGMQRTFDASGIYPGAQEQSAIVCEPGSEVRVIGQMDWVFPSGQYAFLGHSVHTSPYKNQPGRH